MIDRLAQRSRQYSATLLAGCAFCLLFVGCGERLPETVPVAGKVSWQDGPLTDGTVVFHPHHIEAGRPKRPATGKLQADGSFVLTTFRHADGAVPGDYRVTIHSYASDPAASDDDERPGDYRWRIPERYGDPSRSGLVASVDATTVKPQSFAFELTGDAPE
jgi:hypothetical protein